MADHKLPSTVAVQVTFEVPIQVTATSSFGRVALSFGNDVSGVRFMGTREQLLFLVGQAWGALDRAANEDGGS